MTWQWMTGTGAEYRMFYPGSVQVADLKDSPGVNTARERFYAINSGATCGKALQPYTYEYEFGLSGLWNAGANPTRQFIGSYLVEILQLSNNTAQFIVSNCTSFNSTTYHIFTSWDRGDFSWPGGNMYQIYTWTEPIRR
jgi:hypothetical protein